MNTKKYFLCAIILMRTIFMLQAQNTNLPVGAIPGVIDVSPMGAATYTIPIEVVPGTQGMQPNLSITYNSFGGMGLLGMKWNLSGLSAITRCGQTPYYDDNIETIKFNHSDKFAIDGNRLLPMKNGNYGSNNMLYATECEDFTRVVSTGGSSTGPPDYFTAYTDDGTIIEYGRTNSEKHILGSVNLEGPTFSWWINKITDFNGNTMTFHYKKIYHNNYATSDPEMLINEIHYTSNQNAGIQSYAKVKFDYTSNTLNPNNFFVWGYTIPQTKLLQTITVSYKDTVVRKYVFNYNLSVTGEQTAHLKEIFLYNGDNVRLNETVLTWGELNNNLDNKVVTLSNIPKGKIITGDFNGDGYADCIVYGLEASKDVWKLFTKVPGTDNFTNTGIWGNHNNLNCYHSYFIPCSSFYSADINGDGYDELIIIDYKNIDFACIKYRILSLKNGVTEIENEVLYPFSQILFGDFDCNGITDILFVSYGALFVYSSGTMKTIPLDYDEFPKANVGDFDGDGKTDIHLCYSDGAREFYSYDFSKKKILEKYTGYFSTPPLNIYTGDFNGDGITDILTYDRTSSWQIYFGVYNNCSTKVQELSTLNYESKHITIADINGDGKDDIIQFMGSSDWDTLEFKILLSNGCIDMKYKYGVKDIYINVEDNYLDKVNPKIYPTDINNDGIIDLIIQDESKVIYLHKNKQYNFVKQITDGLSKKIKLTYKPKYYFALSNDHYPIEPPACFNKYFLQTVDTLHISNGLNGYNTLKYQYGNPVFNLLRREFLGFEEFTCVNNQDNMKEYYVFQVDGAKKILKPSRQRSYCGSAQTNEKNFNYIIVNLPGKRFAYHNGVQEYNFLSNSAMETYNTLNNQGRLIKSQTKTYNTISISYGNYYMSNLLLTEEKNYFYKGICNQQKTVIEKIITTQQYYNSGNEPVIADTLSFGYSSTGRMNWERKSNKDGAMKTTYSEYTNTGSIGKKTITSGNESRTETYFYDATQRFVTQIKNFDFPNFITKFTYDAKTGNKLSETDINDLKTIYKYDAFGNLNEMNYPGGTKTKIFVNWHTATNPPNAKYFTTTTSSGKPEVIVYYDVLGREVCRKEDGYYYQTMYNNKGQLWKTSGPFADFAQPNDIIWHEFTYDEYGRKKTEQAPYTDFAYSCPFGSRKVTVTDKLRGNIQSSKDYDALGKIIKAVDTGGEITYKYEVTASKQHKIEIDAVGAKTTIISDLWGNRLSIKDPDAGEIKSSYNNFGELVSQTDARNCITNYQYDKLGRVTQKQFTGNGATTTFTYLYDIASGKGKGQLAEILENNAQVEKFYYDKYSHLEQHKKIIDGTLYYHNYRYNPFGQLDSLIYPDGFAVKYKYSTTGKLEEIINCRDNSLIYKVHSRNKYNAPTRCEYGNGITTDYTYNDFGLNTRILTEYEIIQIGVDTTVILDPGTGNPHRDIVAKMLISDFSFNYNSCGLISSRNETVAIQKEQYKYDNLDRLTQVISRGKTQTFSYDGNGNINAFDAGIYTYGSPKLHAVTKVTNAPAGSASAVTYNFFNQPTKIYEGNDSIKISYGANQQRSMAKRYKNGVLENTIHYVNKYYERSPDPLPVGTRRYHYIYGDNGIVALHIHYSAINKDSMYYVHTDHLGSYCAITNENKKVRQSNRFDPWGNNVGTANFALTARGFTGHEHYPQFKIINMNGRLYDPVIARFFSPDTYVQNPGFTQAYNRYSYCLNNPLKYVDPTGQWYRDEEDRNLDSPRLIDPVVADRPGYDPFGNYGGIDPAAFSDYGGIDYGDGNSGKVTTVKQWEKALMQTGNYKVVTTPKKDAAPYEVPEYLKLIGSIAEGFINAIQTGLDAVGLIPGAEFADGVNALIYFARGDYENAGLSAAAMVPFLGWGATGTKVGAKTYSVYQGFDKATGAAKYVGITSRTPAIRFSEHLSSNTARSVLDYRVVKGAEGLSKTQARVLEQQLINEHGLQNLLNLRNSIAPKYWWQHSIKP